MGLSDAVNRVFRNGILHATTNPVVRRTVERYGMQLGAARFVAGESLDQAIQALRRLEDMGFKTNTTIFGEHVFDEATADAVADEYIRVIDRLKAEGLRTNIALKPTHLGLSVSREVGYRNVRRVVEHGAKVGTFVRMDMEDSPWVDGTLGIYRDLREAGLDNSGVVLQAYLYRSEVDLESLLPYAPKSGSSRAPISNRPTSPTRARPTSIAPTSGWPSARSPPTATRRSPRTTEGSSSTSSTSRSPTRSPGTASSSRCSMASRRTCSSSSSGVATRCSSPRITEPAGTRT